MSEGGPRLLAHDPDDQRLRALTHPADHENPRSDRPYGLVVIGAGAGGLVTALGAAGLGARVALIEEQLLGGDCLVSGCVPSKALIAAARAGVGFPEAMRRARAARARLAPHDSAARIIAAGVDLYLGRGRFLGGDRVGVGDRELRFRKAVIATGARPRRLAELPGAWTSEEIWAVEALPRRLAVVGGGPIGCELAQAFARLGSEVHLVEAGPRLLPRDDPDAAAVVQAAIQADGVRLHLGARVLGSQQGWLTLEGEEIEVDGILLAVGRVPNVEDLGLEAVGLDDGVRVDASLRTAHTRIWAVGDVALAQRFTHAADASARVAIRNALFPGSIRFKPERIPWCTFTDPELAQVGPLLADAGEVDVLEHGFEAVDRAVAEDRTQGFVRILLRKGSDTVVACTIVGEGAGELIAIPALMIAQGLSLRAIGETVLPYPTRAEVFRRLADAWSRGRLTPGLKRVLGWWLG